MDLCSHSREKKKKCNTICTNLLPVGKDLVKEDSDSGSDRGVPHTSDSDRPTKFRRGQKSQNIQRVSDSLGLKKALGVRRKTSQ